jgi:hypothetical protein
MAFVGSFNPYPGGFHMSRFSVGLIASCLCLLVASSAAAQADMGFKGMGVKLAYVGPEDVDATVGFGVFANLGTIVPRLSIEPNIGYWTTSEEEFGTELSVSDFSIGAKAKYGIDVKNSNIEPFFGGGLGLHFLSAEVSGFGMSISDSETKLGLDFGGGVLFPVNPQWQIMTELWYSVVSDVNQVSLGIGLQYNLGM